MQKIKALLTYAIAGLATAPGLAWAQRDDCKKLVLEYIDAMAAIQAPPSGKAYYLHFTSETLSVNQDKTPSYSVEARVYLASKNMTYQTGQMTLLQDADDAFMIIHPQKKIIWARGGLNPDEKAERFTLGNLQKSFVEKANVSYCGEENQQGQNLTVIRLAPDQQTTDKLNIKSFTFFYSAAQQKMKKVIIDFALAKPLQRQTITYHSIDFDYQKFVPSAAYDQVFASPGKLAQVYRGYVLIDNKNPK